MADQPKYVGTIAKTIAAVAAVVGIAALGTIGVATYKTRYDPEVSAALARQKSDLDKRAKELDSREEELHHKFFGTLDELTQLGEKPMVPPEYRPIYVRAFLGEDFAAKLVDNDGVFFDKLIDDVHIRARKGPNGIQLVRRDAQGALLSAHSYAVNTNRSMEDILTDAKPHSSIWFGPESVKVAEHEKKAQVIKGSEVFWTGEGKDMKEYDALSQRLLKDFKALYLRGPMVPEKSVAEEPAKQ